MNLKVILKMLGVKVPDGIVSQLEGIIPQIPVRLAEAVQVINTTIQKADERMAAIEKRMIALEADNLALLEKFSSLAALLIETREEQRNGERASGGLQREQHGHVGGIGSGGSIDSPTGGSGIAVANSNRRRR